ncbi:unnamed protein product [marine sediment metagenome]|uniref:Uncharacterized protein n=1 Tax=marine sediment metagenome TaxID=412755 RepID=X0S350_9ZZZZ
MQIIQNYEDFVEMARGVHRPELAKQKGQVYQIWEDGEITVQESGDLLWQNPIQQVIEGLPGLLLELPVNFHAHEYAFVSATDAVLLGRAVVKVCKIYNGTKRVHVEQARIEYYEAMVETKAHSWGIDRYISRGVA